MIPQNLTIINYHKIEKNRDIGLTTRHPDQFNEDLQFIKDCGFSAITFKDLNSKTKLPAKPIIITFDDAYLSFYDSALAILKTHKMTAIVFVPVNFIGEKNNWDVQFFKKEYWHMNQKQISDSAKEGMEIGSHALSHRFLNNMNSQDIKYELRKSKQLLEEITSTDIISVSYPFGRVNLNVLEQAKTFYKYGVQLLNTNVYKKQFQNLCLTRINIYRTDNKKTFKKKLDYYRHPFVRMKCQFIQSGALATILMQKIKTS